MRAPRRHSAPRRRSASGLRAVAGGWPGSWVTAPFSTSITRRPCRRPRALVRLPSTSAGRRHTGCHVYPLLVRLAQLHLSLLRAQLTVLRRMRIQWVPRPTRRHGELSVLQQNARRILVTPQRLSWLARPELRELPLGAGIRMSCRPGAASGRRVRPRPSGRPNGACPPAVEQGPWVARKPAAPPRGTSCTPFRVTADHPAPDQSAIQPMWQIIRCAHYTTPSQPCAARLPPERQTKTGDLHQTFLRHIACTDAAMRFLYHQTQQMLSLRKATTMRLSLWLAISYIMQAASPLRTSFGCPKSL